MVSIKDIKKFTSWGNYTVDIEWGYLPKFINDFVGQGLQIEPDFQRGHVWSVKHQTAYVEFGLRGGKSGREILFNNPNWTHYRTSEYEDFVLVDGLQRITAVTKFINNELKVFDGYLFSDFTDLPRVTLRNQRFHVTVNDLVTKKEVLNWYLELNSGGVVHTEEELNRVRKLLKEESSQ
jgi:uncharacterized protein with ParB-like and HNH nuclease domain